MKEKLNRIRSKTMTQLTIQQKLFRIVLVFLLGSGMGFLAKYFDSISFLGDIGTELGVWVLVATLLAIWSRSPEVASLHVFIFFESMLIVYYTYSMVLFGFFPKYYFIVWNTLALLSIIGAYILWYARGIGWISVFCASIPISLLVSQGITFFYTHSITEVFDLFAAVLLIVIVPKNNLQRLRLIPVIVCMILIIEKLHLVPLFFGGL